MRTVIAAVIACAAVASPAPAAADRAARAVCASAAEAADAPASLGDLAARAASRDRALATACSRAAVRIAARLDRDQVLTLELPDDELRAALEAWRAVGADAGRWADVRVHALVVGSAIHRALGADATADDRPFDRDARLADPDPMVRRAAAELTRYHASTSAALAARLADDDPAVAIAAAQSMCEAIDFGAPAAEVIAAAGAAGMARMRELVVAPLAPAARLGAARCLAADDDPASRVALAAAERSAPRAIRAALRAVRSRGKRR